jgi:catechol 2,3-dioxygenase-like lactoylglutathione lyase family enzyme
MNLNQVTVPVRDIEVSAAFYRALGLKLIVHSPHYARFECPDGGSTFSIHQQDALPTGAGITVYFEREDLNAYVNLLIGKGIAFDDLPKDQPWLWREASLRDPDGNQLILFWAGKNRLNPPWRVGEA